MGWVLGVDGCPGGWIGALLHTGDGRVQWRKLEDATAILALDVEAIGIDIPIGLPSTDSRACDLAARRRLKNRGATVFPAPPRVVLGARTHREACERARAATGKGISIQTWSLVPRIADVDRAITLDLETRVAEVHPEVSFTLLAREPGQPLPPKRTRQGRAARIGVLAPWLSSPPPSPEVDALDALAVAWSTARFRDGRSITLGDGERDQRGLLMRILV